MDLWMDLLFGNPVGLASMIVIFATVIIVAVMAVIFIRKSREE
jgi:heme/copper-type cytochrome/quinol oxidase subunit 2